MVLFIVISICCEDNAFGGLYKNRCNFGKIFLVIIYGGVTLQDFHMEEDNEFAQGVAIGLQFV